MKVFFYDQNRRCCFSRELNDGEEIPQNAVTIDPELGDMEEAYFESGAWRKQALPPDPIPEGSETDG